MTLINMDNVTKIELGLLKPGDVFLYDSDYWIRSVVELGDGVDCFNLYKNQTFNLSKAQEVIKAEASLSITIAP